MEKVNRVESCFAVDKFHKMKSKEDEAVKKFIIDDLSKRVAEHLADIISSEAQPERKRGKWIDNETSYSDDVPQTCTCSVCGMRSRRPIGNFCKWCGVDMREDTDNQITVCPMCPDCPDNCPLGSDMRKETEDE